MRLKRNKTDYLIILVSLLVIASIFVLTLFIGNDQSDKINIYYKNKIVASLYLNSDTTFTMEQKKYGSLQGDLVIEVNNGKFRVKEETSRYNLCSKHGWEDRPGYPVVCLPNYVMVVIEGFVDTGIDWEPGVK